MFNRVGIDSCMKIHSEKVYEIRHKNARKVLQLNCDKSIKLFADRLDKKEQQASNILRENNPANIGDKIARQIEETFGYSIGWLDIDDHHLSLNQSNEELDILSHCERIKESIKHIGNIIYDEMELKSSIVTSQEVSTLGGMLGKLRYILTRAIDEQSQPDLFEIMTVQHGFGYDEDNQIYTKNNLAVKPIVTINGILNRNIDYLRIKDTNKNMIVITSTPVVIDGHVCFMFISHKTLDERLKQRTDEDSINERILTRIFLRSRIIGSADLPVGYKNNINTHPLIAETNK